MNKLIDVVTNDNDKQLGLNREVKLPDVIRLGKTSNIIDVRVKRALKARHVGIRVSRLRVVELVLPEKTDFIQAQQFLVQKENWIRDQLTDIAKSSNITEKLKIPDDIPIWGKKYKVILNVKNMEEAIKITNEQILVSHLLIDVSDILFAITIYLQGIIEIEIARYAGKIARKLEIEYNKISVREAVNHLGDCREGNLFFSWRLVFAPQYIMEYVVVRELCGFIEKKYSNKFIRLFNKTYPNSIRAKLWLKKYEKSLYSVFNGNIGRGINRAIE